MAGVGDIDFDGFEDYIIGEIFDDTMATDGGKAVVRSGLDNSVIHTFYGFVAT